MISATVTFTPRSGISGLVLDALVPGAETAAELVAEEARRIVAVDTGDVQSKIVARPAVVSGTAVTVAVVSESDHGGYLEFGTGQAGAGSAGAGPGPYDPNWPGMVAQPYLRPAMDTTRSEVLNIMRQELKSVL